MSRFAAYCARRFADPLEAMAAYFEDAQAAAASVGALLESMPDLDGVRHYLPDMEGRRDKRHWYVASLERDRDGTAWPCVTFGTFKHGGASVYWKPRDLAWREFEAANDNAPATAAAEQRAHYQQRAAELLADAEQRRAERDAAAREGHAAAAREAAAAWEAAAPCAGHPYLTLKAAAPHGLRVATADRFVRLWSAEAGEWQSATVCRAGELLVPMRDAAGDLLNLQRITATGTKRFLMGGRKRGLFHRIGGAGAAWMAEGYATAATVAAATGAAVLVAFDSGNLSAVAESLPPGAVAAVAADNDASGAGRKGAEAAGLPYAMPPAVGDDWNDHAARCGLQSAAELLRLPAPAAPANDNAPAATAFADLSRLPAVELAGREAAWFVRLAGEQDPQQVAALAWAIVRKRGLSVPVTTTAAELLQRIREAAGDRLHPETMAALERTLSQWAARRQRRALSHVTVAPELLRRHRHEVHPELPELTPSDYQGVILLWAPMASGKTQRVGQPFAALAAEQGGRFVATCHRRSLVAEMAHRLGCEHYGDVTRETAWAVRALATCLPSITKAAHRQVIEEAEWLFVDEIAQVLRFLESAETCRTDDGTNADVYHRLRQMVARARCVIGADAGLDSRTVRFLEECRPGEQFRIIEVRPNKRDGLQVAAGYGADAIASLCGEACARLADGQRLWIGCESEKRVAEVARLLESQGANVLAITASNKGNAKQAAFWRDPEGESRRYDVVIHSPVISSGLSIEHRDAPHFDHGMFIGGGHAITPADAAQMLRRVRYLRSWSVALVANTMRGMDDADSILCGMEAAASAEGLQAAATGFDAMVAGIKADNAAARGDFAAGLLWVLERAGFTVEPLQPNADAESMAAIVAHLREVLGEERRAAIVAAPALKDDEARRLRSLESRTQEQSDALAAHAIRGALGVDTITPEALDVWADGRGPRRLDRFTAAVLGVAEREAEAADPHLSRRRWSRARVAAYRYLFDGLTIAPGLRITDALAAELVRRVIERRHLLAWLGVVPAKFGGDTGTGRDGEPKPYPMPKTPQKDVGEIFRAMGLELKRRRNSHTGGAWYELEAAPYQAAAEWAARRNAARRLVTDAAEQCHLPRIHLEENGQSVTVRPRRGAVLERLPVPGAALARMAGPGCVIHAAAVTGDDHRAAC